MEANEDRHYQIATALFDDYVYKRILNCFYVISEGGNFDERELGCLAVQMGVDTNKLHHAISLSCGRIAKESVPVHISKEDELEIMKQAAKLRIRQSNIILDNYKRELPRLVKEINHSHFELKITVNEVKAFIKPLFIEVIEEVLAPQE
jgi:hypothetical protein